PRIGADANAVRTAGERDEPIPVALADQVHCRCHAEAAFRLPVDPFLVVRPVLDIHRIRHPEPGSVDVVPGLRSDAQLPAERVGPAGRIDDPAGRDGRRFAAVPLDRDGVAVLVELDVADAEPAEDVGAQLDAAIERLVLELSAIDLVAPSLVGRNELDAPGDVAVVPGRPEVAESGLAE